MQDYGRDPQYADASIDAMREQKLAVSESLEHSQVSATLYFASHRNYNVT